MGGPLHVTALSGGKDSTALALRMAELGMPVDHYVITPTGDEPAAMIAHWRKVSDLLGKPLTVASQGRSLAGEIRAQAFREAIAVLKGNALLPLRSYQRDGVRSAEERHP